jgi:integrase
MRDQGQGHIRQRGRSGRSWELKFDLGRDPVSGKRLSRYIAFRGTKREAQAELNRLLTQRTEGSYVDPTKMTVGEYLDHWLRVDIDRRVAVKTAARHHGIVQHQIKPILGQLPMRKLMPTHIEAFEAELRRSGYVKGRKAGGGLTAQTILHVHRTLTQALGHAVKTGVLFKNPALQVKPPRPTDREIKILTKPEIAMLLRAAEQTWLYLPILVGITTGIRRGELLGLRWSYFDLKAARLTVNHSLERVNQTLVLKPPKTKRSRRTITLPALTVEALARWRAEQASDRLKHGLGKPVLVFSRGDDPLDPDSVSKAFGRLVRATGVTPITFHGLRHTHISHQLIDGVHIKVVSERAGHANVNITLAVYAAFIPNMQADAAAGVDAWLRNELAKPVGGKSVAMPDVGERAADLSHCNDGGPERTRTSDLRFRKPLLYPAELRDRSSTTSIRPAVAHAGTCAGAQLPS